MFFFWPLIFSLPFLVSTSDEEYRLLQDLRQNYDPLERPVSRPNETLRVDLRIILQQLVDVDEKNQVLTLVIWAQSKWNDYKMRWDPKEYGNITQIQIPSNLIWKPDILLFNSADEHFDASFPVNAVISFDGNVLHAPPGIVKISCEMIMTWFPFDEQICYLKYGCWTNSGSKVNLTIDDFGLEEPHQMDIQYYVKNGEFDLLATPARVKKTEFNDDHYIELEFQMYLKRKTLYYGLNWVLPSVLISLSNVLGFTMPPECGEKITLQITNLLSVTVFLGMVSDVTPPTSESIPILAAFFSLSMLILGCSIICTIVIINVYFRSPRSHTIGPWTKFIFLEWLPWLLMMSRPDHIFLKPSKKCSSKENSITKCADDIEENVLLNSGNVPILIESTEYLSVYTPLETGIAHIVELLRTFQSRLEEEDENDSLQDDWRFIALVIDRLSLFFFSFLVTSTIIAVFLCIPNTPNYIKFE